MSYAKNKVVWFYYTQSDGTCGAITADGVNCPTTKLPTGTTVIPGTVGAWPTPAGELWAVLNPSSDIALVAKNVSDAVGQDAAGPANYALTWVKGAC